MEKLKIGLFTNGYFSLGEEKERQLKDLFEIEVNWQNA